MTQIDEVIRHGQRNRALGESILNQKSSRSHSIVRFTLSMHKTQDLISGEGERLFSELNLVDLAGSEALDTKGGGGDTINAKESKNINLSLCKLVTVINELTKKQSHISYRNSNLTKILARSLGGNAQTALIGTLSPLYEQLVASRKTLDFLKTAKKIQNKPFKNASKTKSSCKDKKKEWKVLFVLMQNKMQN